MDRELPLTAHLIGHYPAGAEHEAILHGVALGLPHVRRGRPDTLPTLDIVPTRFPTTCGGRYFPRRNAILVYGCHDADVVHATIIHEGSHWRSYMERCGAPAGRSRCGYHGDHDATFYAIVGPLYRALGASRRAVQTVEGEHPTADYPYPPSLLRALR